MNLFSNIRRAGRYFLPALLAFGLMMACSDDEVIQTPLSSPNVTNSGVSVSSLTFTWDEVANVSSYSCELLDPNNVVVDGLVTTTTTARFTGLTPNTTYTLNVYAYAAIGSSNTTSKVATLTATTDAVTPLRMTTPNVVVNSTTVTLTWEAVEHAVTYEYSYMKGDEEITASTTNTSLTLRNLSAGDYRISISAIPAEEDEAYSASPAVAVTFSIVKAKVALWERTGIYYSEELAGEWEAKLTAYDDGSYKLSRWYGVEGYDLDFTVEGEEMFIQNHYAENGGYFYVYTGRSDATSMGIYTSYGYSFFEGNENGGELWFYAYGIYADDEEGYGGYEYFEWSASGDEGGITVDDLVGSYVEHTVGYDWTLNNYGGAAVDNSDNVVTITKVDDQTISIANFYGSTKALQATVDLEKKTLTFAAGQSFRMPDGYSYVFGKFNDEYDADDLFVATFDDNCVINFSGWTTWYYYTDYSWWYYYMQYAEDDEYNGAETTLTKQ